MSQADDLEVLKTDGCPICGAKYVGPGHKCQDPLADKCEIQKDALMEEVLQDTGGCLCCDRSAKEIEHLKKELKAITQSNVELMGERDDALLKVEHQTQAIRNARKILESVL